MTLWAAQVISDSGGNLDIATVLLVAGVNTTSKNRVHAETAIDLITSGLFRKTVRDSAGIDEIQLARLRVAGLQSE